MYSLGIEWHFNILTLTPNQRMSIFPFHHQVRFDSVGGLSNHIAALKEMVVFPLLYPEVFEKFKIQPPR